jgi:2-polyprenyl-3-methyl-5-hydroxy-6-metoxy-1,4-benzoquinol methylase
MFLMDQTLEEADVETASADYARRFAGAVGTWFLEVQARVTLALLRPWPGARVLDVGGGHGQLTGPLVDAGFEVTVHGSRDVCGDRVREWVDRGRARFEVGNVLALPFPDRSFDVVLAYRLLPHVTEWQELASELTRLATRAVVVDYPTRRSANAVADALFGLKKGVEGNTRPFTVFRDRDIEQAFAGRGFQPTARHPEFFFPMALHRGLGLAPLSRGLERAAGALRLTRAFGSPVILRVEPRG